MAIVNLYHGSSGIIEKPEFGKGKTYNDYGLGFYCTENPELSKEWACTENLDGYANHYQMETENLRILNLSEGYTVLNWLAVLLQNRRVRLSTPVENRACEYLKTFFLPDYNEYDIIVGYRADDSYFSFARAFLSNGISLNQLNYAMKLGKLGEQVVLKSKKAFQAIRFIDYIIADNAIYYAKRKARDEEAKEAFNRELSRDDLDGIFMRDIIREEMKPDDERLQ